VREVGGERGGQILQLPEQTPLDFRKGLDEAATVRGRVALGMETEFERLPPGRQGEVVVPLAGAQRIIGLPVTEEVAVIGYRSPHEGLHIQVKAIAQEDQA
jgi:hypothetical protein